MVEMTGTARYGRKYWCIKTAESEDGEIYVCADRMVVHPDGSLIAYGSFQADSKDPPQPEIVNLAIAAGRWTSVFAASLIDGAAIAVEHWKGEVLPRK